MGTRYSAYVLRHWQLADGQERVEVQQMATGEVRRYRSLADAYGWLTAQDRARAPTTPAPPDDADLTPWRHEGRPRGPNS